MRFKGKINQEGLLCVGFLELGLWDGVDEKRKFGRSRVWC